MRDASLAGQKAVIGPDGGHAAPDRRGAEPQVLEQVDEIAEVGAGDRGRLPRPARQRELAHPPEIPQVGVHRVRAVPGLEAEIVAEALEPEGAIHRVASLGDHRGLLLAEAPAHLGHFGPIHAEKLGRGGHQPILVGADGTPVAEGGEPHPFHQLEALGAAEALAHLRGIAGESAAPLGLGLRLGRVGLAAEAPTLPQVRGDLLAIARREHRVGVSQLQDQQGCGLAGRPLGQLGAREERGRRGCQRVPGRVPDPLPLPPPAGEPEPDPSATAATPATRWRACDSRPR